MAKDYKNSPKPKDKPKKKPGGLPGWGWFVLGLVVAFVLVKTWPYLVQAGHHAGKTVANRSTPAPTGSVAAAATPSTAAGQPHFDFYKMLPSFQVVIPGQDKQVSSGNDATPVSQPGSYILQAGSFQTYAEADKLKANLALLGIESSIQPVRVASGTTWNRVRIGPISDLKELNAVRAKLAQNHIEPLLIRAN